MIDSVSPSARCLSVCLSSSWGSVPVKAKPCSHTAWAGHPTLNYLTARICINAHARTHTYAWTHTGALTKKWLWDEERLSLPRCSPRIPCHLLRNLFSFCFPFCSSSISISPSTSSLFDILRGLYHFPGEGIHADIAKARRPLM